MSYPMTAPALLRAAADRIETYGHHKGWYVKGDSQRDIYGPDLNADLMAAMGNPPCCVVGAIYGSRGPGQSQYTLSKDAMELLGEYLDNADLPYWNDMKSRRKTQVVAALRKAADAAEKS